MSAMSVSPVALSQLSTYAMLLEDCCCRLAVPCSPIYTTRSLKDIAHATQTFENVIQIHVQCRFCNAQCSPFRNGIFEWTSGSTLGKGGDFIILVMAFVRDKGLLCKIKFTSRKLASTEFNTFTFVPVWIGVQEQKNVTCNQHGITFLVS